MSDEMQATDSKVEPQAATVASKSEPSALEKLQAAYQQVAAEYGHARHVLEQHQDTVRTLKARIMQFELEFAKVHAALGKK